MSVALNVVASAVTTTYTTPMEFATGAAVETGEATGVAVVGGLVVGAAVMGSLGNSTSKIWGELLVPDAFMNR